MKWYTLYLKLCRKTRVLHNKLSYMWRETLYPHIWTRLTWLHHFITMGGLGLAKALANLYWSVCNKPGEWTTTYSCARCINYISASIIFGLDFKTVQGGIFSVFYLFPYRNRQLGGWNMPTFVSDLVRYHFRFSSPFICSPF
jgi:hypothetical protein